MTARDAPRRFQLLLLIALALFCARLHAQAPRVNVAIPEGPAQRTFQMFFAQTRIEILYLADVVKDVRTHAVTGDLDADEAVREMIAGTGLEFQFFQNYSFVSLRPKGEAREASGAKVSEREAALIQTRNLRDSGPLKLEQVTVTGTYIPGLFDITAPLVITSRKEALSSSYATVQDALAKLPMASKAGPGEDYSGNGNFNRGSSINLRGLGSGATLVLVNGRRQAASGMLGDFVDISALPITAIDRIELLPDGASALYGSDAIAGVVNIILRNDMQGLESFVRRGTAIGGGNETLVAQLFGTNWADGKLWGGYQYLHRSDLGATERRYSASSDKTLLGGTDFRSFLSSPGNIYNPNTLMPTYGLPDKVGPISLADLSTTVNRSDRMQFENLLPDRIQHNLFLSAEHDFNDQLSVSAEGRFTRRDIRSQYSPQERPLGVPATNPFAVNPFSAPVVFVGYSFDKVLGPIVSSGRTDSSELFLTGDWKFESGWKARLSGWRGEESLTYHAYNRPNPSALIAALNSRDPATAFDPFGNMTTPETLALIRDDVQHEAARSQINVAQALLNGSLFAMRGGDAKVAIGLEHRTETFQSGVQIRGQYHRQSDAFFTELALPLYGDPHDERATPRLDLSVAGRFEKFNDFGNTANPKMGLRWAPNDWFKLRGSWGTSFKAPRVTDLYDTSQNVAGFGNLPDPASPTGRSIVLAIQGNNPKLHEEKARTWTLGFDVVLPELMNTRFSGTFFSTSYQDRISIPSSAAPIDILRQGNRWQSVVHRDPTQEQIDQICSNPKLVIPVDTCRNTKVAAIVDYRIRNLSATDSRGFDFRFGLDRRTPIGLFNFDMLSSYYLKLETAVSPESAYVNELGTVGNPMRFRGRATLQWWQQASELPGFNARIATDYNSSYEDIGGGRSVTAFTSIDAQFGFRTSPGPDLLSNLDMSVYVANVLNHQLPFLNTETGYDALNSDPYGRVWSVMLEKRW